MALILLHLSTGSILQFQKVSINWYVIFLVTEQLERLSSEYSKALAEIMSQDF